MKPVFLLDFLRKELHSIDFLESIELELSEYIRTRRKFGASSHIVFEGELHPDDIDQNSLVLIMKNYLNGELGEWELEYLFKWIEMAEVFENNEKIEKILFNFSTPEINYPINSDNIKEALSFLKGETLHPDYKGSYKDEKYQSLVC